MLGTMMVRTRGFDDHVEDLQGNARCAYSIYYDMYVDICTDCVQYMRKSERADRLV